MMSCRRNVSLQQNGIVFCLLFSPLLFKILQPSHPGSEMTLCHLNCQLHKTSPEQWVAETKKKTKPKQMFGHNPYSTNHVFKQFNVCLQITNAPEEMGGGSQADLATTIQDKGPTTYTLLSWKIGMQHLGNTSGEVCRHLSVLPNILKRVRFLQSFAMKLWYHPDVPLSWGGRLWERGWPDTMQSNTAGSEGGMMLTPCFWMFPELCRIFYWEMLAKGTLETFAGGTGSEGYSGVGMGARAIGQARAEALYSHPRSRKLLPFLPPRLTYGLQKAHMKTHGLVPRCACQKLAFSSLLASSSC